MKNKIFFVFVLSTLIFSCNTDDEGEQSQLYPLKVRGN